MVSFRYWFHVRISFFLIRIVHFSGGTFFLYVSCWLLCLHLRITLLIFNVLLFWKVVFSGALLDPAAESIPSEFRLVYGE